MAGTCPASAATLSKATASPQSDFSTPFPCPTAKASDVAAGAYPCAAALRCHCTAASGSGPPPSPLPPSP